MKHFSHIGCAGLSLVFSFCFSILAGAATESIPLKELPQNARYAIWGDSITETPAWYPRFVEIYLLACAGRKDIKVCTFGHSGERAGGLQNRQSDLEAFHPTLVSFFWGMNDSEYSAYTDAKGRAFDANTRANIALLIRKGIDQRVIVSPSYVEGEFSPDPKVSSAAKAHNNTLSKFRDFGRAAAVESGSGFADIYNRMKDSYSAAEKVLGPGYSIGIHVTPNGALMIAHEILKTLTCDGNIGTIDVDMKGTAHASAGHSVVSFSNGAVVLDSSRYPFCYNYDPSASQGPTGLDSILPYLPFSAELNRLILKVTNLDTPDASVTWGSETQTFTSHQLAKGVNLAAEFDHTPFDATFARVMTAVVDKETFENFMIKGTSNYFGNDNGGNVDENMIAVQEEKDAAVKVLAVPVRHTILIVPTGSSAPAAPVIVGIMMAYPVVGQPFTYQVSALNSPSSFAVNGLPKGLSLDERTGRITGTPAEAGVTAVSLTAKNATGESSTVLTLTVAAPIPQAPVITSAKTAEATVGTPFTYQITATNNPNIYFAWMQSDRGTEPPESSLPPGLTYDGKSGKLGGTLTRAGTYTVQIAAMNDGGVSPMPVTLTVKDK